jgi:4'-phosphopantetheinyl transferase EntD
MFDPAAMGTLIIGLDAAKADTEPDRPRRLAPARRRGHRRARIVLANALRQAAAAPEPSVVGDTAR